MLDHGNGQLSAVGFFNPGLGEAPVGDFFGGAPGESHPQPYEVQWDGSLNGGSGGWEICLPTGHLLSFDGTDIDTSTFTGVSAIPDAAPWYWLNSIGGGSSHVWLAVTVANSTGAVASVKLTPVPEQKTTQTTVYNICVAELSMQGGAGVVKQSLVGALHVRGDAIPPDDISVEHFIEDAQSGERKLQIKGFKEGSPEDGNSLSDYLLRKAEIPSSGLQVLARREAGSDGRELFYLPLASLFPEDLEFDVVTKIRYDLSTHYLQMKTRTITLGEGVTVSDESEWTNWTEGYETVPHGGE